jgi:transposase
VNSFRRWVKQRHPEVIESKSTEPPALFFQLYAQWKQGEVKTTVAARMLGISQRTFYKWATAQGSSQEERREWRTVQFEKIFVKWKAKKLSTEQAAKSFGVSEGRFREWVRRLHPDAMIRKVPHRHSGYTKFPFYYAAYRQKKVTLEQAATCIDVSRETFTKWIRCCETGGEQLDFAAAEQAFGMSQDEFLLRISAQNKDLRSQRKEEQRQRYERVFLRWKSKELTQEQAAETLGIELAYFRSWVRRQHPGELPTPPNPEAAKFPLYYQAFKKGKIRAKTASEKMGIHIQTFYLWVHKKEKR